MRDRSLLVTITGCCLVAVLSSAIVAAQGRRAPSAKDLKGKQREREQREAMLRTSETRVAVEKIDERRLEAEIEKVREDFRRIQIVRNEMVRNLLAKKPLDFKLISDETAEINRRSERLRKFLMPPVAEEEVEEKRADSQIEFDKTDMEEAMVRLCNLIANFIDNPVLKTPGKVDVEESVKAGGDLLSIIELSGNIKRIAERLSKSSK